MSPATTAWILTGMSGAGRATAAVALERAGAEVADNLPAELLAEWARLPRSRPSVAVVDSRQGASVADLVPPVGVRTVFLTADDAVLAKRCAESLRPHPCAGAGSPPAAIQRERELLAGLRAAADVVVDTAEMEPAELGRRVVELVAPGQTEAPLRITVSSFGYKFGPEAEADWVVDARFLRNPFWELELRPHTGLEEPVRAHVMGDPRAGELCDRLAELLGWATVHYRAKGRRHLHVAIGCTGGRHRSVVVAEELGRRLRSDVADVAVRHRDVDKPDPR